MNIFSYFQRRGIDTVDASFYRKIEEWKSWYNANVRGFSSYRVYSGQGTYKRCRRKSLGMAKKLSEDIADLLLNERVKIHISNQATDEYVQQILEANQFLVLGNDYQERKAYTGTVAYVPYLDNIKVEDGSGRVLAGEIRISYVSAENIFPISWSNGTVMEVAFTFVRTVNRKKYVHVQFHQIEEGQYVIENTILECEAGSREGKELSPEEWKQLKPFQNLADRLETGTLEPQFVIDKLNIVNNADQDESNPMGVAVFANAIDTLRKLDTEYDSYYNEFDLGRKRIFVAPEMLYNADGSPAFDPEDTVFYRLPEEYAEKGEGKSLVEVNMELRAEEHSRAINDDLNYLSLKCGFGTERYRFDGREAKTATEVISVNSDLYRRLKKHEIILDSALRELIQIIIRLGNVLGKELDPEAEVVIDFDDSIIEDKQAERQQDRQDVAMGAMTLLDYRMKWYQEPEAEARKHVISDSVFPDPEEE